MLLLFDTKEQPYGLLSNAAKTPFQLKKKMWNSVTQYVYVNMFTDTNLQRHMEQQIAENKAPYPTLMLMSHNFYGTLYRSGLEKAMDSAINASPKLKFALVHAETIKCEDASLEDFYQKKRQQLIDNRKTINIQQAKRIVDGVIAAIKNKTDIDPYSSLSDLKRYEIGKVSAIKDNDDVLNHLDELVPYLQFKMSPSKQLNDFKRKLFSAFLDNKFETDFPNMLKSQYGDAKADYYKQNDALLPKQKDEVYNLYLDNKLPKSIADKFLTPPTSDQFVSNINPNVRVTTDSDLSPHNMGPVTVDGTVFASPFHYAFWQCFITAGIKDVDVNAISTNELPGAFEWYNGIVLNGVLVKNAEDAIAEKFKTHTVLGHLLNTTVQEIVWNDQTDPVLGIGDGSGQNVAGKILMTWRGKQPLKQPMTSYKNLTDNIFYKNWLVMRLGDIYNTMLTMTSPTTDALQDLYKFPITNNPKKIYGSFSK